MLSRLLPAPLIAVATFVLMLAWLLVISLLLAPGLVLKVVAVSVLPVVAFERATTRYLIGVADLWVQGNALIYRLLQDVRWQIEIDGAIVPGRSYLLISNHQSWVDILVLCDALRGRVRFPRYFLKKELIWVPIIGITCWAMDMPFMKRHSREAIARNPALRGDDLRTTREFCAKYRGRPFTTVMFPEGTRATESKRREKQSPYRHLLRPKSGGLAFTLNAMGDQFAGIIDATVAYRPLPAGRSVLWSWLCGQQPRLALELVLRPLPADLIGGDHDGDDDYRARFQGWLNELWLSKDARLEQLRARTLADVGASARAPSRP